MNFNQAVARLLLAAAVFAAVPTLAVEAANLSQREIIDLAPGKDVYGPAVFALNRVTHKLYVGGQKPGTIYYVKVIDTRSQTVIAGIDLRRYSDSFTMFRGVAMAMDDGPGPAGNKLYIVGQPSNGTFLRVIDGETDTNATGEGTDIFLPIGVGETSTIAVNPKTHKVYVGGDQIAIVDGATRKFLKKINPDAGSFLVASPAANRVFVLGRNGGAVIDGETDVVSALPQPLLFTPADAFVEEGANRIWVSGRTANFNDAIYVLDATTGELLASKTGLPPSYGGLGITVHPAETTVYLSSQSQVLAFDTRDLSAKGGFAVPGGEMVSDPAVSPLLYLADAQSNYEITDNAVRLLNPQTSGSGVIVTAHMPSDTAVNARTGRLYVVDARAPELTVIDNQSRTVIARVPLPDAVRDSRGVAVNERLNQVYVPRVNRESGAGVDVYDGSTHERVGTIAEPQSTGVVAVDSARRRLYLMIAKPTGRFGAQSFVRVYDTDTLAFVAEVQVGGLTFGQRGALSVNPITGRCYMAAANGVAILDGNTLTVVKMLNAGALGPLAVNRRTGKVYLSGTSRITVLDGYSDTVETEFSTTPLRTGGVAAAVDEQSNVVYVTDGERVAAFDGNDGHKLVAETQLGYSAGDLDFCPATRQLFIPNAKGSEGDPLAISWNGEITVFRSGGTAWKDQFGNLSTRLRVGSDENAIISGFIVEGAAGATKKVIVRAVGPSLQSHGVEGVVADTTLELHTSAGDVITNDDWKINASTGTSQQAAIEATGLAPSHDLEAAIIADLPPGAHTAVIRGKDGAVGVGLAEIFVLDPDNAVRLANVATRGRIETGENVMIGGMILVGIEPARVLVRAIGPSLKGQVDGALEDTVLELRGANGDLLEANDDWKSDYEANIATTGIPPTDERESAIVAGLFPGNYTAIVRGKDGATGIGLVEAYHLPAE
jgi:hypothetical protein